MTDNPNPQVINNLQKYRMPSLKNVGKGPDGKVIPHHRSEVIAKVVSGWVASGADESFIAAMLNIRPGQLRENYSNELLHGAQMANMQVAGAVFEEAVNNRDMSAAKFWLKSKAGWRDGNDHGNGPPSLLNIFIHP
jgi:hypothetical protein